MCADPGARAPSVLAEIFSFFFLLSAGLLTTKRKMLGKKNSGGPLKVFFRKNEKCLELPEMARKLIGHLRRFFFACVYGRLTGGSSVCRPGSKCPHRR